MNDFEEIGHCGGKMKINIFDNGYQIGMEHNNSNACSFFMFSKRISNNDDDLIRGLLFSDAQGYFGRKCLICQGYFRTKAIKESHYCCYCGYNGPWQEFCTDNQKEYINLYIKAFIEAILKNESTEINFDALIDNLSDNRKGFIYSEEHQQSIFKCDACNTIFDVLGEYSFCPNCGKRNSLTIFLSKLNLLEDRIESFVDNGDNIDKTQKELEEMLKSCIADFEGFCNDTLAQLVKLLPGDTREKVLRNISFQRIIDAKDAMKSTFEIDFMEGFEDADISIISKLFNFRHLLTHKSGIVDQKYINNTQDYSVRIGQKVRIDDKEILRLIDLSKIMGIKLFERYESTYSRV